MLKILSLFSSLLLFTNTCYAAEFSQAEKNLIETYNQQLNEHSLRQFPQAEEHVQEHITWWQSHLPIALLNVVTRYNQPNHDLIATDVDAMVAYMRQRNLPLGWIVGNQRNNTTLIERLNKGDFRHLSLILMAYKTRSAKANTSASDNDIKRITLAEVPAWVRVAHANFNMTSPHVTAPVRMAMESAIYNSESATRTEYYANYKDDALVATGALSVTPDYAKITSITTLAHARKQGLGTKMLAVLLQRAQDLQIPYVLLEATEAGLSLYEKTGFVRIANADRYYLNLVK